MHKICKIFKKTKLKSRYAKDAKQNMPKYVKILHTQKYAKNMQFM